jgi:hypothetical protein
LKLKSFDDYEMRLGDIMRGERATLGKSLLDVQRELRIKAPYIAAIEDANPSAFDTPGFISGYVRSYARFLKMDPDKAFAAFCAESGFVPAHGMSAAAAVRRPEAEDSVDIEQNAFNPFVNPKTPFLPTDDSWLSRLQYNAVGSIAVLLLLIGGIGFGGWSLLREIQRVQIMPVDQAPLALAEVDPLQTVVLTSDVDQADSAALARAQMAKIDRLYRPKALDAPVLVPRDGPIATLDPSAMGAFIVAEPEVEPLMVALESPALEPEPVKTVEVPIVLEEAPPELALFAIRPAWVRIRSGDGDVIFEKILDAGEEYILPQTEVAPVLRAGMSGSIYFKVNGQLYGPAGNKTSTIKNVSLSISAVTERYAKADVTLDPVLARMLALAKTQSEDPVDE